MWLLPSCVATDLNSIGTVPQYLLSMFEGIDYFMVLVACVYKYVSRNYAHMNRTFLYSILTPLFSSDK